MSQRNRTAKKPSADYQRISNQVFEDLMSEYRMVGNQTVTNPVWAWGGRLAAIAGGGGSLEGGNPNRDLNRECGYEINPTPRTFKSAYDRVGVANRYVNIWPDECWAAYPEVYEDEDPDVETPFEKSWRLLSRRCLPWHFMHRADRLSRIGRFGIILLGVNDGRPMEKPVAGVRMDGRLRRNASPLTLNYMRAYDETNVTIYDVDGDPKSPRFNQPTVYQITYTGTAEVPGQGLQTIRAFVHWTRVVHVADNRECSEVLGVPVLLPVLNDVYDIRKVAGSSAEMFYKGGFPGYSFTTYPDLAGSATVNKSAVREEVLAYQNGLQRFLSAVGGEWKSLAPQVADPSKNLDQKIQMLCATGGFPVPVFLGMQQGHLAGTENSATWKERVGARRENYLEPMLVRPTLDRLVGFGCLAKPKDDYQLAWKDLKSLGEQAQAEVGLKRVQALMQYVTGRAFLVLGVRPLFTTVLGYSEPEADMIITRLGGEKKIAAMLEKYSVPPAASAPPGSPAQAAKPAAVQGGGKKGTPAKAKAGRPKGRVEKRKVA